MISFRKSSAIKINPQITPLPNHVAIILDGNGRWAEKRHLPRLVGHHAGVKSIRRAIRIFAQYKIKHLTLYVFSTENWNRPYDEVKGILRLLMVKIDKETKQLHESGVQIRHFGSLEGLSEKLQERITRAVELTKNNKGLNLNFAFNYGGRAEIIKAVRQMIKDNIHADEVNEALFSNYLYTADLPDPDLIIRTGGEMRISNFLVWQSVYSEYYSTPVLWPDFNEKEIDEALLAYSKRKRRFGGLDFT